jgi:hypothetical protein
LEADAAEWFTGADDDRLATIAKSAESAAAKDLAKSAAEAQSWSTVGVKKKKKK